MSVVQLLEKENRNLKEKQKQKTLPLTNFERTFPFSCPVLLGNYQFEVVL